MEKLVKCPCGDPICDKYLIGDGRFDEETARLYIAAPDMLSALREMVALAEIANSPQPFDNILKQLPTSRVRAAHDAMRAAIAKATGGLA